MKLQESYFHSLSERENASDFRVTSIVISCVSIVGLVSLLVR